MVLTINIIHFNNKIYKRFNTALIKLDFIITRIETFYVDCFI